MLEKQANKMMTSEEVTLKEFHFGGSGIWRPKTIRAESREIADQLWKEQREAFEAEEAKTTTNE